jgi:hypothetical protein
MFDGDRDGVNDVGVLVVLMVGVLGRNPPLDELLILLALHLYLQLQWDRLCVLHPLFPKHFGPAPLTGTRDADSFCCFLGEQSKREKKRKKISHKEMHNNKEENKE